MANIKLSLDVDDKALQAVISKKRKVAIGIDTKEINQKLGSIAKEAKQVDTTSVSGNIKKLFSEIGNTITKRVIPSVKSSIGLALGAVGGVAVGGVLMMARGVQSSIEKALPMATSLRGMFGNIDKTLFSNFDDIKLTLQNIAKATGVPFEELAGAVESILPSLPDQSIKTINDIASVFSKLKYLENIDVDTFMTVANVGQLSGKTLEEMGQLYNIFTDSVRSNVRQIKTEMRKLAGDFGGDVESMFASIEYFSKYIDIDPREIISKLEQGIKQYKDFVSGAVPADKMGEYGKLIADMLNTQEYADIFKKYLDPGTLAESYKDLAQLPATQMEQFFAKAREAIKGEMYEYAATSMPSLEKAYKKISDFATKNFGEFSPIVKSVFISPETGMPTLATAVIPVVDKLVGIKNSLDKITNAVVEFKTAYETTINFWAGVITKFNKYSIQKIGAYPGVLP